MDRLYEKIRIRPTKRADLQWSQCVRSSSEDGAFTKNTIQIKKIYRISARTTHESDGQKRSINLSIYKNRVDKEGKYDSRLD